MRSTLQHLHRLTLQRAGYVQVICMTLHYITEVTFNGLLPIAHARGPLQDSTSLSANFDQAASMYVDGGTDSLMY